MTSIFYSLPIRHHRPQYTLAHLAAISLKSTAWYTFILCIHSPKWTHIERAKKKIYKKILSSFLLITAIVLSKLNIFMNEVLYNKWAWRKCTVVVPLIFIFIFVLSLSDERMYVVYVVCAYARATFRCKCRLYMFFFSMIRSSRWICSMMPSGLAYFTHDDM